MRLLKWVPSLLLLVSIANAAIISVPSDQPTIQAGINVATDGDTVLVRPRNYHEWVYFQSNDIFLISTDGPDSTVIIGRVEFRNDKTTYWDRLSISFNNVNK